jgi:hypothetical protein
MHHLVLIHPKARVLLHRRSIVARHIPEALNE